MGVFLYTLFMIAVSVILSIVINLYIMRKITETAVLEIQKIENRIMKKETSTR